MANLTPSTSSIPLGPDKGQSLLLYVSPNQTPAINLIGLTASNYYHIKPNGMLSGGFGSNPLNATTWATLPADVTLGTGIFTYAPGCKGLLISTNTQAMTTMAGGSIFVMAYYPPPPLSISTDPPIYSLIPFPFAASSFQQNFLPTVNNTAATANSSTLTSFNVPAFFGIALFATTWPTAAAGFSLEARLIY